MLPMAARTKSAIPATGAKLADVAEATREDLNDAVMRRAARSMPASGPRWRPRDAQRLFINSRNSSASVRPTWRYARFATTARPLVPLKASSAQSWIALSFMPARQRRTTAKRCRRRCRPISPIPSRAGRRCRCDRALELSAAAGFVEGCAGARRRLHDRAQAGARDAADGDRVGQDRARSGRTRRRSQRRHRLERRSEAGWSIIRPSIRSRLPVRPTRDASSRRRRRVRSSA